MSARALQRSGTHIAWLVTLALVALAPARTGAGGGAPPPPLDPAARLPSGGSAFEYWDLTAQLDSGHRVVARFLISNAGPGDQLGAALGYLIQPDGTHQKFKNGRTRSNWKLSSDRLFLDIGSSHLDLHHPEGRLQISKSNVKIDLGFRHAGGESVPPEVLPEGYQLELLAAAAPIQGTIWLKGLPEPIPVRGQVALVHSWSRRAEQKLLLRRIEFFSLSREHPMYLLDLTTPKGKRTRWFHLTGSQDREATASHETLLSRSNFELRLEGSLADEKGAYWTPQEMQLNAAALGGQIELGATLMRHNPLGPIPMVVRWLVSRGMRPQQVWATSRYDVTVSPSRGSSALQYQGSGVTMVTFLNRVTAP